MALIHFGKGAEGNQFDNCEFNTPAGMVVMEFEEGARNNKVTNSKFNTIFDARDSLNLLMSGIKNSSLDSNQKTKLTQEIINTLSAGQGRGSNKDGIVKALGKYVGDKAVDLFVNLLAGGVMLK